MPHYDSLAPHRLVSSPSSRWTLSACRVAADRGLILGNHHVMPMNLNVYAYPKGVPYTYR